MQEILSSYLHLFCQVFKSNNQLQGSIESYEEIQSTPLISSVDNQSTVSPSINRIVVHGEGSQTQVLTNETYGHLQKEGGNLYGALPSFVTSPVSSNSNSTAYLTLDSLQSPPTHVLLNTAELSNGHIDTGVHYFINASQLHSINGVNQAGNSQVLLVQVPTSQTTNQVDSTLYYKYIFWTIFL